MLQWNICFRFPTEQELAAAAMAQSPYAGPPLPKIDGKRQVNSERQSIEQFFSHESFGNAAKNRCLLARL